MNIYNSLFQSYLGYGLEAWGGVKTSKIKSLFMIQKKCIRNIACEDYKAHTAPLFSKLRILKVCDLFKYNVCCFMYKYDKNICPSSFNDFFTPFSRDNRTKQYLLKVPKHKSLDHFPSYQLAKIWNGLRIDIKRIESQRSFKKQLKTMIFDQYQ